MLKNIFEKKQSISVADKQQSDSYTIGNKNLSDLTPVDTLYLRTRRSKCLLNLALEDFSRIHGLFSDKSNPAIVETAVFSLFENEKIKFQLRLLPGKHDMRIDALYRGSDTSANLYIEVYLLDKEGHKYAFDYGRKIDIQIGNRNPESLSNYVYDRDELEKKRDRLFQSEKDKLVVCIDVNATWCEISDKPSD